jgi:hypothetical protein
MKILLFFFVMLLQTPLLAESADASWVRNGQWSMRLVKIEYVSDLEGYQKLPWNPEFQGEIRSKNLEHLKTAVFAKEKRVALLTIDLKNTSGGPLKVGTKRPYWMVRCDDGQQVSNNNSFMRQISTVLEGGMPAEMPLAAGQTRRGVMAFFIPNFAQVNSLFFKAPGHLANDFGETESLVLKIQDNSVKGGKATTGASASNQPWVSNGLWKMRITDTKYVDNLNDYKTLPWNERMTGDAEEKHMRYVSQAVFPKKKRLILLKLELKNLHPEKQKVGVKRPYWFLQCSDGKVISNNHSFTTQVSFLLKGGLPQETLLNPNETVSGWLAFFIPQDVKGEDVFYKSQGHVGKSFGESQSIVLQVPF